MSVVTGDSRQLTRKLLACGIVAGPLFFGVAIIQHSLPALNGTPITAC
jgi:hypothetical protein